MRDSQQAIDDKVAQKAIEHPEEVPMDSSGIVRISSDKKTRSTDQVTGRTFSGSLCQLPNNSPESNANDQRSRRRTHLTRYR